MSHNAEKRETMRRELLESGIVPIKTYIPDTKLSRGRLNRFIQGECNRFLTFPCPTRSQKLRVQTMMGWKRLPDRGISSTKMIEYLSSSVGISSIFSYVTETRREKSANPDIWDLAQSALLSGDKDLLLVAGLEIWESNDIQDRPA